MELTKFNSFIGNSKALFDSIRQICDSDTVRKIDTVQKKMNDLFDGVRNLEKDNSLLTIGIVGQMKTGKSSFLNSFLFSGQNVLPKAATPMTAGLTIIEYTPTQPYIEVEYYTAAEWKAIERVAEEVAEIRSQLIKDDPYLANNERTLIKLLKSKVGESAFASYEVVTLLKPSGATKIGSAPEKVQITPGRDLSITLDNFVGARGIFTSVVKALHIYLDNEQIQGLRIVDTPGINDPVVTRNAKTMDFLRQAHGVLMFMDASTFFNSSDIGFMNNRLDKEGVASIVIVGNKVDILCANNTYRQGNYSLNNALSEIKNKLTTQFNEKKISFNNPNSIKGFILTSGLADGILQKLDASGDMLYCSSLDEFETHMLNTLKSIYPCDFSPENIHQSLESLTESELLYNNFIVNEFIHHKEEIIDTKLTSFVAEHRKEIVDQINDVINDLNNEQLILDKESVASITAQMNMLSSILQAMVPKLMIEINAFVAELGKVVKHAFQSTLVKQRPNIASLPTITATQDYTRDGTWIGFTHKGSVSISRLDTYELNRDEANQVERFRNAVYQFWYDLFCSERSKLIKTILDGITEVTTSSAGIIIDVSICRNLINDLVKTKLAGLETLELYNFCEQFLSNFTQIMSNDNFIEIDSTFDKISAKEAEKAVIKKADNNLANAQSQVNSLNLTLYNHLKKKCNDQNRYATEILEDFKNSLSKLFKEEINRHTKLLTDKLKSKKISIERLKASIDTLQDIKNQFVAL